MIFFTPTIQILQKLKEGKYVKEILRWNQE